MSGSWQLLNKYYLLLLLSRGDKICQLSVFIWQTLAYLSCSLSVYYKPSWERVCEQVSLQLRRTGQVSEYSVILRLMYYVPPLEKRRQIECEIVPTVTESRVG